MASDFNDYPFWKARFWHGMRLGDWLALVARNRFRVHPARIPMALLVTGFGVINSSLALLQSAVHGRRIRNTELVEPPVFIVGHWRSGTTLLHELMVCDPRYGFPNTYECFAPSHCVVSEWWASRVFGYLAPRQRPMDNMKAGMKLPQEDEFALVNLGAASPYQRMAFPNHPPPYQELLDMQGVDDATLERWKAAIRGFAQLLSYRAGKRLVFKSPPHTGRIGVLAELFPGARFVHITRHPVALFASTMRLWTALDSIQGLQRPSGDGREEYVLSSLERMYDGFQRQRESLEEGQLYELRYEDLVADPLGKLQGVYDHLRLGDFGPAAEKVRAHLEAQSDYRANRHPELSPETRERIASRWRAYATRYGYCFEQAQTASGQGS